MSEHFIVALLCFALFKIDLHETMDHDKRDTFDIVLCVLWFVLAIWFAVKGVLS